MNAANAAELVAAIHAANAAPDERYIIHLTGKDSDYVVDHPEGELFGGNAFPVVIGNIFIHGHGRTISRLNDAPPFRFFGVYSQNWLRRAKLVLYHLNLINGDSGQFGGGAIVNDGDLVLDNCVLQSNRGSLGGAIYCGDGHLTTILNCVFTRNICTQQGGALYGPSSARIHVKKSQFYQNIAPQNGSSVVLTGQHDIYFEECMIQEGITIPYVTIGSVYISPLLPTLPDTSYLQAFSEPGEQLTETQIADHPTIEVPSSVEMILTGLEESQETSYSYSRINSLIFNGQVETLRELIGILLIKIKADGYGSSQYHRALNYIKDKLISSTRPDSIQLIFDTLTYFSHWDYREIASWIGNGQSIKTMIEFFNQRAFEVIQEWFEAGNAQDTILNRQLDVLATLAQEMVIRGVPNETMLRIRNFLEARSGTFYSPSGHLNDLLWLPLYHLDIEDKIEQLLYEYNQKAFFSDSILSYRRSDPPVTVRKAASRSLVVRERVLEPHERIISLAVERWQRKEVRLFTFDTPITEDDLTTDLLIELKIKALEGASEVTFFSITANQVLLELFVPAFLGGVHDAGEGAANGRLRAWQSLAALVGAGENTPVTEVRDIAKQTQWYFFRPTIWVDSIMDIGIIALRPDRQTLVILAASDTD